MTSPTSLRQLFEAVLDQPPEERARFLVEHCEDASLRAKVDEMLRADASTDTRLERGASELAGAVMRQESMPAPMLGSKIGQFELIAVIGEGGSSTVFRAVRTFADVPQIVALKLLHRPLFTIDAQRRFKHERLALSQLRHPGIARLIEGGITEAGFAYIVLELVDGEPITEFVRAHRLDLRQRLRLFRQTCRAVESAHRALVVHRDLKPSNVFVTEDGEIKLLDFGIAKMLDAEDDTQTFLRSFTPAYAAPEQRGDGLITTATDVYSLGILLGELITGERLNSGEDQTPSENISEDHAVGVLPAAPAATRRQLRGDLDNIVLKAIDANAERRYVSAGALADDIDRLLDGMPVAAHPPSAWYRTLKFVNRHRGGTLLTVAFMLAVFAALGIAVYQGHIARREAQRADAVRDFLVQLFDAAKSDLPTNQKATPESLVDEAETRLHNDPSFDAELRAELLLTLGTVTRLMGEYPRAEKILDEASVQQKEIGLPSTSPQRLLLAVQKGQLLQVTDRNAEADALLTAQLPQLRRESSQTAIEGLMTYSLTRMLAGHYDEAFNVSNEAAAKAIQTLPAGSLDAIKVETFPGQMCVNLRRRDDCVAMLERPLARWRGLNVPLDLDFAQALDALAVAKDRAGDSVGAEKVFREGIDLRRKIFAGHPNDRMASALEAFAIFLTRQERFVEAQALSDESIDIYRSVLGPENEHVASALDTRGTLEQSLRQFDRSETDLRASESLYLKKINNAGQQDDDLAYVRLHLAATLLERGNIVAAQNSADAALADLQKKYGGSDARVASTLAVVSLVELARDDASQAQSTADRALAIAQTAQAQPRVLIAVHSARARIANSLKQYDRAIDEADEARKLIETTAPHAYLAQTKLWALRARAQSAAGHLDDAQKSINNARALNVPPDLLSPDDVATINHE